MASKQQDRELAADKQEALAIVCERLRGELRLGGADLAEDDKLDLLPGADSVRLMRVVADLERRFDVEFDDEAIRAAETVGDMARLLVAAVSGNA